MLAIALPSFAALDVIFVEFSDTPAAALTFAVMSFLVLLLLSGSAGSFGPEPEDYTTLFGPMLGPGLKGFLTRIVLASVIPVVLLVALAYVPDLNDPLDPSETVRLGSSLAGFWLLMSLALVGAVLGFLWPRSGALDGGGGGWPGGVDPEPAELGQVRRQPGGGATGAVYVDGVGVRLPDRSVGGIRPTAS
jgi:hypothetical protein